MKINKYIKDKITDSKNTKLLSYGALAAAFLANAPDTSAQCAGETAVPGAPVGLDIDGDGTDDVQIFGGSYTALIGSGSTMIPVGTIPLGTFPVAYAYAQASIPAQPFTATPYYGCSLLSFGYGPIAVAGSMLTVGPVATTATAAASAMVSYISAFTNVYFATYALVNYCFVTGLGSNQIVGLPGTGSGVCGLIDSAPGVSGAGTSSLVGSNYTIVSAYAAQVVGGIRYDFPTSTITAVATAATVVSGITCTTDTAAVYGGYFVAGPNFTLSTMATASVPPQPDATLPGPYLLAGPYYGSGVLATGSSNPITAVAVQFIGGDGNTYNGWVSLTCNGDGTITCSGSGYQQCSIETAIADATAADSCIDVGEATNNNPACSPVMPVCDIASLGLSASACNDAGTTAEDNSADGDDTFTLTINPTGTDLGATYTISGDVTGSGTYGTPFVVTPDLPADGATITVTITDDTDTTCTLTETISAPAACSMDSPTTDIPTLSQWGLITLMLALMSYGAIAMSGFGELAATLRRKEEE